MNKKRVWWRLFVDIGNKWNGGEVSIRTPWFGVRCCWRVPHFERWDGIESGIKLAWCADRNAAEGQSLFRRERWLVRRFKSWAEVEEA